MITVEKPTPAAPADGASHWTISTAGFELLTRVRLLSPEQRAAVRQRPRFHSMPWLARVGENARRDDADSLP